MTEITLTVSEIIDLANEIIDLAKFAGVFEHEYPSVSEADDYEITIKKDCKEPITCYNEETKQKGCYNAIAFYSEYPEEGETINKEVSDITDNETKIEVTND